MSEKIYTLTSQNKKLLRDFFNTSFGYHATSIIEIRKILKARSNRGTYERLRIQYNLTMTPELIMERAMQRNMEHFRETGRRRYINSLDELLQRLQTNSIPFAQISLEEAGEFYEMKDLVKQLLASIGRMLGNQQLVLEIGGVNYVLNDQTRNRLLEFINNNLVQQINTVQSDAEVFVALNRARFIIITKFIPTNKYKKGSGAFFKYTNNTDYDFERYGIFKTVDVKNYEQTCLIYALQMGGLESESIDKLNFMVKNRNIPLCDIQKICDKVKIQIKIQKIDKSNHNNRYIYGKEFDRVFHIGLIDEHYFLIEETNYTSFSLIHYFEIKELKDCNYIIKKQNDVYKRDKTRTIDSFSLVKQLWELRATHLELITFENSSIASTQFYDKISNDITNLNYDESTCVKPVVEDTPLEQTKKKKKVFDNVYFDFETYTDNEKHYPYLVCSVDSRGKERHYYGLDCGLQLLKSLSSNTRLIAHNANYDYRFIMKYLSDINELSRGNRLISCNAKFGKYDIQVKDSYHLISMPLRDFPEVFGIDGLKEVMPYELYKADTIAKRFIDISYALEFVKEEEKEQFLENIKRWNLQRLDTYDILEYSKKYCEIDCHILKHGYKTFQLWMLSCVSIDIDDVLTIASLAHKYFMNQNCYDDVYSLGGIPQMFIQKCVVGGRTMVAENIKNRVDKKIQDFDAVSLYPSAMKRMDGFLQGKPKVIEKLNYSDVKTKDGYFVEIVIKSVGIKRKFSLMSFKNNNGVREFTNDMIGKTMFLDKIMLEDLITFQDITFDIIRGYYFDDGFNTNIKNVIEFLFNERLKKKKEGNKCEMIYKLIMNSGYGKSIMKAIESETRIFDNMSEFNVYLSRNYNWVNSYTNVDDSHKIKVKTIKTLNEHFNICQVGVSILSMSKRIMNEVMCLAEDNKINIYYQDTDSMHLEEKDIENLSDKFQEKYERTLIGKSLGQFHSDFNFKGCKNIYASRSIFLGKKCYIDELKGEDEITGETKTDYHIRMKGIPNACVLYTSKKNGYKTPFDMYEDLFKGKMISFDLTNDGSKCNFKFNKNYSVNTLSIFNRKISFK